MRCFVVLTWVGGNPVEGPFVFVGQVASVIYFIRLGLLFVVWVLVRVLSSV